MNRLGAILTPTASLAGGVERPGSPISAAGTPTTAFVAPLAPAPPVLVVTKSIAGQLLVGADATASPPSVRTRNPPIPRA